MKKVEVYVYLKLKTLEPYICLLIVSTVRFCGKHCGHLKLLIIFQGPHSYGGRHFILYSSQIHIVPNLGRGGFI